MTERYSEFANFDSSALSQALGAESRSMRDVAHGEGEALTIAGKATLEVYPSAGVARVTTQKARVEVFCLRGMTTDDEAGRVVFQHDDDEERTRLLVRADGNVSFNPVLRATETPTTDETTQTAPLDRPTTQTAFQGDTASPDTADPAASESAERPVITLTGRLGQDPWYTRREEVLVAGFPLAVNQEEGQTTWHKVVAQGDAAEQVDAGQNPGIF